MKVPHGERLTDAWHICALASLALAQPLFDLLGRNGAFFVASRSGPFEVLLLVVLLVVGVPAVLVLIEVAAGLIGPRLRRGVHLAIIGTLLALIAMPALGRLWDGAGIAVVVAAVLAGMAGAAVYAFTPPARQLVTFLSVAIVVVPANFLLNSDARKIVFPTASAASRGGPAIDADTPVVLLIFDELPLASLLDEHLQIDAGRYPNFARLASGATWYRNATSVADSTTYAIPAILTGQYPRKRLLATTSSYPDNLFTLLGGAYAIHAHEPLTNLCPPTLRSDVGRPGDSQRVFATDCAIVLAHALLPADLAHRLLPPISQGWRGFATGHEPARSTADGARSEIVKAMWQGTSARFAPLLSVDPEPRSLTFIHLLVPHAPWRFLPSGDEYGSVSVPGLESNEQWTSKPLPVRQSYQRHLLQVGFADRLLGHLLTNLRTAGRYDDALLVVLADHGASFRPGDSRRRLTRSNWSGLLRVPLLVKRPGQRQGAIVDRPVQTIDVLPTVADVLDIDLPVRVDGQSLLVERERSERRTAVSYKLVRFQVPDDSSDLRETVLKKVRLFGSGSDTRKLFGGERYWPLVGKRIDDLDTTRNDRLSASLAEPHLFTHVRLGSGFVPALISGQVSGARPGEAAVVAVNRLVMAVAPLVADEGSVVFHAVVPASAFRQGRNDVDLYVANERTGFRLRAASIANTHYGLTAVNGAEVIEWGTGRAIVRPGAVRGTVDTWDSGASLADFTGWVADVLHGDRPTVLLFADGRFVASARPSVERADVARAFNDNRLLVSGYALNVPSSDLAKAASLRAFGVSDRGTASELAYAPALLHSPFTREYRLVSADGAERIESEAGRPIAVQAGAVHGSVDTWSRTDVKGYLSITGWAAGVAGARAVTVLVFADDRLVGSARPTIERPDVAKAYKDPRMLFSGYAVRIPLTDVEGVGRLHVVVVTAQGTASELKHPDDIPASNRVSFSGATHGD